MVLHRTQRSASRNYRSIWNLTPYAFILFSLLHMAVSAEDSADTQIQCIREGFDLGPLDSFSPWITLNDNTNATIHINLCSKLKIDQSSSSSNCPEGTSICAHYPNKTAVNFGSYDEDPPMSKGSHDGELMMVLKGQACPDFEGEQYSSIFYFKCGKTLGHPFHIGDLGCSAHFEWESYIFCKDLPIPKNEVPCTVMKDGHLVDLSPLIKLTGAYLVDEIENRKIYINVCRDIKQGTGTDADDLLSHCPEGSASCRLLNDKDGVNYGHPSQRLEATSAGAKLIYTSDSKPAGCVDNPTTTINFRCPHRGGSKDPVLLTDFLGSCSMEIEWVTEYACPVEYVTSETCKLTSSQHDVDIDLSPLKHKSLSEHPYMVNVTDDNGDHYIYYMNVCEQLGFACGHGDHRASGAAAICQKKLDKDGNELDSWLVGESHFMRYSDGELTMIHRHGDKCHTDFRRTSFINFVCNKTAANDGKGYPTFVSHENCSYTFEWQTKYACVDHPVDDTCRVDFKGKRYDLSPLVKEQAGYWQVLAGDGDDSDTSYFLNVCHTVFKMGPADGCPMGSAMCSKGPDGFSSLGKYIKPLEYNEDSKSLKLTYTDGDKTGNGCIRSTVINFYCHPGVVDSPPILVHKSLDGCYHEVEWQTAAACVLSHKKGNGCRVVDDDAGYTFDINSLKSNASAYKVETDKYSYYINVCEEIKGTDNPCSEAPHSGAAICQVEKQAEGHAMKIGEPATLLEYYDGVVNLTYSNGEAYNNQDHTPRSAEIAFECDVGAGKGKPEFLEEKDFTYAFRWRTSYVCPLPPMECAVTDTVKNLQYDLSSLSKTDENWVYIDDDASKDIRQKFYINVCRSLSKSAHCSTFASACVTNVDKNGKETLLHGNLGRLAESPVPEKTLNGVKIIYTNGNDCKDDSGAKKKYLTIIHFICVKGKLTGKPSKPVLIRACEYSIVWETEAACPIEEQISDGGSTEDQGQGHDAEGNCTIKDPNSDFTFNLKPLAKFGDDFYSVTHGTTTYKLNICGKLSESVCQKFESSHDSSVCEDSTPVARLTSDLSYSSTGELSLEYKGKNNIATGVQKKYTLIFLCDRTAQAPVIKFDKQESTETVFRIKTALACPPQPVDCAAQDNYGRQYDLSALALKDRNWMVIDNRPAHSDLRYHINVCRPVNPTSEMTCPGGAVGGCQTGGKSFNLGYVQSKPVVSNNGSAVSILYQGGDICHRGKDNQAHRSTRIIFTCSPVAHDPVFLAESDTCEYTFIWKTPSACPQHSTTGSGCKVTEDLYNNEFDLNPLHKNSGDYTVKGKEYNFLLNVCGPLTSSSGGCSGGNVGACQTGGGLTTPVELGKSNSDLIYDSGELRLVYTEGKANCHGQFTRKTIIRFVCDDSQSGLQGPSYLDETSECVYEFVWTTQYACPPSHSEECIFRQDNNVYDLTPLVKVNENYEITRTSSIYIINVCRSLVQKPRDHRCSYTAGACQIDQNETDLKKKYHNIGEASTTALSLEQGKLVLKYSNGDMCADGKTKMGTQITFECDPSSDALGIPESHFVVNECLHHFLWTSRAACPLAHTGEEDNKGFGDCKVKNPQTGYEFDLSSLKSSSGYSTLSRGDKYTLNVCGWLDSSSGCSNGTGSCQTGANSGEKAISAGKANANLIYRDGVIALEYSDGDVCEDNGKSPHTTIINFVCMEGSGKGLPVFIDKSSCVHFFDWHTDLVCEKQITCSVDVGDGHTLDFSPLIQHSGKYNVLPNAVGSNVSPGVIYLNLCRPLNPVFGTLCPPGSGVCQLKPDQKPVSLGHVHDDLVYDPSSKEVRLTYSHGDACPSNPKINSSSLIILKCGQANPMEGPELDSVTSDCQYVFVWITPYACQKNPPIPYSACSFYDAKDMVTYDLSSLTDERTVSSAHVGTFTIKACGHFEEKGEKGDASCSQSAVCLTESNGRDGSYGAYEGATVKLLTDTKAVTFESGKSCKSGGRDSKASSTIHFKCGSTAGSGQPLIIDDGDCDAVFEWPTSLVCPPVRKECRITDGNSLFDFSLLSQETGSWNYTDSEGNVYWLNLCQGVHGKALEGKCPHHSAVCMKGSDGSAHMLGDINTQSIKVTGDKDKRSFLIQYTDGDTSLCKQGRRRRSDSQPTVIISLTCADTIGAPVLKKHDKEKCTYEFSWKTRMACPTKHSPAPVNEVKGLVKDERSGKTIDLNRLLKPGVNAEVTVSDQRFLVNLHGQLDLSKEPTEASVCRNAAICHYSGKTKKYRNLGSYSKKMYYLLDEQLEAVFTSSEQCDREKSSSNITSTIIFNCADNNTKHGLDFLYHTKDCSFFFEWKTDIVCLQTTGGGDHAAIDKDNASVKDSKEDDDGVGSSKKVAIGFLVFFIIAFVCVLVLVLHKPEKRAAAKSAIKRLIFCRKRQEPQFSYSMLSQSDNDNEFDLKLDDDDPFNPFNEPDEEAEINNGHLPRRTFHDDSDDDILIT